MITVINSQTICVNQQVYPINISDNVECASSLQPGCRIVVSIFPDDINLGTSIVSSSNIAGASVDGNSVIFICTGTPWFINLNLDISNSGLLPGDSFQIAIIYLPAGCGTSVPVKPPIFVEACTTIIPDPGYSIPLFSCAPCKNVKTTIVSTTSELFVKTPDRLFKTQPKW